MAPHTTAKLDRNVSMPRCRNLSAFFGKWCVADHEEAAPSLEPSQKQQRTRSICNQDGSSAVFDPRRIIQELLSDHIAKSLGYAILFTQNKEKETLKSINSCQENASQLVQVSLDLSKQMELNSAKICNIELGDSLDNKRREVAPISMESSELEICKVTEGAGTELCIAGSTTCSLELGDFQEQVTLQNSPAIKHESNSEQSKADCGAEICNRCACEHSVKIYNSQQPPELCMEHRLSNLSDHSPRAVRRLEVESESLDIRQEVCSKLGESQSVVHAALPQGDGRKTGRAEICGSKSSTGAVQIITTASSVAEEYKPGCLKDQEEGKATKVVQRRSLRIKKIVNYGEMDIGMSSVGTGSCMEKQEESKPAVSNLMQKARENDSTSIKSDFFLPASKRSKKQKMAEETHTLASYGERKQKDKKHGQLQMGNSATSHEEFFIPASKKQKQMLNALDPMMKENQEEKPSSFHFDLWTEARLAAEENAQLRAGKPTHPFFAQHKGGQQASLSLGISASACSSHQTARIEEVELFPSPPFHITQSTQLNEAEVGTTTMWSWTSSGLLEKLKVDQTFYRREYSDLSSQELDDLLRVAIVDKLSVVTRRHHASQGASLNGAFEPLLTFLKDSESVSKNINMTEGDDDLKFSLAYLKERLNSLSLERAKKCSHDSSSMMNSPAEEGIPSKNSLWTDLYQPQVPKEVCGNRESVNRLSAWLERWQAAGATTVGFSEGYSIQRKKKNNEDSDEDESCFQGDSNSEGGAAREDAALQNVLFLAGPVGCGKTAAIYACARAQGYEVIEVNCSDNRNGLLIKQKFSESMESHRVHKWSADINDHGCTTQADSTPTDLNVITRSHASEPSKEKRQKPRKNHKSKDDDTAPTSKVPNGAAWKRDVEAKQLAEPIECDKSMTVLLFEDVDMVFEDDRGFMAAVAKVAATAKRPIILTSNDKQLCLPQGIAAEMLEFKRPSTKELMVLAYLVCLAEGIPCRPEFLLQMVKLCNQDLRTLLNCLQFWSQGHANETSSEITEQKNEAMIEKEAARQPYSRFEEAESASIMRLFKFEAQHRLWPSFVFPSFPCQVTQLVACKLNDKVSQVDRQLMNDEEKKLEDHIAKKLAMLKKSKRQKVDSPLEVTAELSDNPETPVKNLIEAKSVARSPVLREKLKKDLAATMLGFADEAECKESEQKVVLQRLTKQDSLGSEHHLEPLDANVVTCDSNGAVPVVMASPNKIGKPADDATHMLVEECKTCTEAYTSTADFKSTPSRIMAAESNPSLSSSEDQPLSKVRNSLSWSVSQSICEPIYALWSEFQNAKEREELIMSSASKESHATSVILSKLSDNLSSSDVMSCVHGPRRTFLEDDSYSWESPYDYGLLQACSTFAHMSLKLCIQECSAIPNLPEDKIRPVVSIEDMMVAVNDPCALGKLLTHNKAASARGFQLQHVRASYKEQEYERYRRMSSLQHALCTDLPPKAQASFQGTSFFEYASFFAKIGHLEQDRLACGVNRRRGRGVQNYFCTFPWNLSKKSINLLEQFGRFGTS